MGQCVPVDSGPLNFHLARVLFFKSLEPLLRDAIVYNACRRYSRAISQKVVEITGTRSIRNSSFGFAWSTRGRKRRSICFRTVRFTMAGPLPARPFPSATDVPNSTRARRRLSARLRRPENGNVRAVIRFRGMEAGTFSNTRAHHETHRFRFEPKGPRRPWEIGAPVPGAPSEEEKTNRRGDDEAGERVAGTMETERSENVIKRY